MDDVLGYEGKRVVVTGAASGMGAATVERAEAIEGPIHGPTDTAMMSLFHEANTKELVDAALGPVGRYSTAEEHAAGRPPRHERPDAPRVTVPPE